MWLQDSGVFRKIESDMIRPPFAVPYPKLRRDKPLILSQLGIVMIVWAVGLVLSLPVFFCELMKGSRGRKKNLHEMRDVEDPLGREHPMTLSEIARLTREYYGRDLDEYL